MQGPAPYLAMAQLWNCRRRFHNFFTPSCIFAKVGRYCQTLRLPWHGPLSLQAAFAAGIIICCCFVGTEHSLGLVLLQIGRWAGWVMVLKTPFTVLQCRWDLSFLSTSGSVRGTETTGIASGTVSESSHQELRAGSREDKPGMVCGFWNPKLTPSDILPLARSHLLSIPKHCGQLGTKQSKSWAYGGHFIWYRHHSAYSLSYLRAYDRRITSLGYLGKYMETFRLKQNKTKQNRN